MSAYNYNQAALTALRLIKQFGSNLSITRNVPGTYNPVDGASGGSTTSGTIDCCVLSIGRQSVEGLDDKYVEGLVTGKVRKALIAAKSATFAPQQGDIIEYMDDSYVILSCVPLAPAGVPVIYTAGMMKQ